MVPFERLLQGGKKLIWDIISFLTKAKKKNLKNKTILISKKSFIYANCLFRHKRHIKI